MIILCIGCFAKACFLPYSICLTVTGKHNMFVALILADLQHYCIISVALVWGSHLFWDKGENIFSHEFVKTLRPPTRLWSCEKCCGSLQCPRDLELDSSSQVAINQRRAICGSVALMAMVGSQKYGVDICYSSLPSVCVCVFEWERKTLWQQRNLLVSLRGCMLRWVWFVAKRESGTRPGHAGRGRRGKSCTYKSV